MASEGTKDSDITDKGDPTLETTTGSQGLAAAGRREERPAVAPLGRGANVGSRYMVVDELGRGGMGVVYRAYDPELDRRLALKLIHRRDPDALGSERLLREAQALAQLSHPNVVAVYDVGTFGSSVFMAMELVEGTTLRSWLRETQRSTNELLDVFLAAGEGLAAAHRANIVHRDFKPSNLLIGSDGRVRVADFGLARNVVGRGASPPISSGSGRAVVLDTGGPVDSARAGSETSTPRASRDPRSSPSTPAVTVVETRRASTGFADANVVGSSSVPSSKASPSEAESTSPKGAEPTFASHPATEPAPSARSLSPASGRDASPADTPSGVGSARTPLSDGSPRPSGAERSSDQLTALGTILGTPEYMSPEQHEGLAVDALSDQYSYCVCLYEAFYGRRPPQGKAPREGDFDSRRGPRGGGKAGPRVPMPRRVRALVARGLSQRPQDRYPSMEALLDELKLTRHPPRPAWPYALAGAGLIAIVLFGYRGVRGRQTNLCQGGPTKMAVLWNPDRRQAVHAAFTASGVPYAEHAFGAVSAALDHYTEDWASAYTVACEDTRLRGEQSEDMLDRRMACLEQRRLELGAKVDIFVRADRSSLEKAAQAAASLAMVSDCADRVRLASRVMPPNQATRAQVERSWEELGRAKALFASGRYAEGEPIARMVAEQSTILRYHPLEADARLTLAELLDAKGEYTPAETTLRQALRSAQAGGVQDVAARAWIGLVKVVGVRQQHHEQAHEWALDAEAHLETLPASDATLGLLLSAESDLLYHEGKFEQAIETGQKARSVLVRTLGSESAAVAEVLKTIGNADADLGKADAARVDYEQARDIWQKALGPEHPAVAAAWNNLGTLQLEHESFDAALANFRHALDIWTRSLGPDHPNVAIATTNIGEAERALGHREEAKAAFQSALAIRTRALGADHPLCAGNIANLGNIALDKEEFRDAYRWFEQALEIWEKRLGPKDQHVATALTGLGDVLIEQKSFSKALPFYQRALAIQEEALGPEHLYLVDALAGLGRAYLGLGQDRAARERLERALAIAEPQEADPVILATIRLAMAKTLWRMGSDRNRARTLAQESRDAVLPLGKRGERVAKKATEWLASLR
jgi:serine/threonine protein kinase/tetratricopeptide (TPR) repeat protein